MDAIDMAGWAVLVGPTTNYMQTVGAESVANAAMQLNVTAESIVNVAAKEVVEYADKRAAEMVGMKYTDAGDLIPNPRAQWAITDSTRQGLKNQINEAIENGYSREKLARNIMQDDATFGRARARMIAQTELKNAHSKANDETWERSGVVEGRIWLLSNNHAAFVAEYGEDPCDLNAAAGTVRIGKQFPSGHISPPVHPWCECDVAAVVKP